MKIERDDFEPKCSRPTAGVYFLGYVYVTPEGAKRKIWARVVARRGRCDINTWSLRIEHANDMTAMPFVSQLCDSLKRAKEIAKENGWIA